MPPENIPDGITAEDVRLAIRLFDSGTATHRFQDSIKYELVFQRRRYPPKAILGIAARRVADRILTPDEFSGGKESKCSAVLRKLGFTIVPKPAERDGWTDSELDAAVSAYLKMMEAELKEREVNKAAVNRELRAGALSQRSRGSVEFRMANISSVLRAQNQPWIKGYRPRPNVGTEIAERILTSLLRHGMKPSSEFEPDADETRLKEKTYRIKRGGLTTPPPGQPVPDRSERTQSSFRRDPAVRAWVLLEAKGVCELCLSAAPFKDEFGEPFLEVHHVVPLADGGPDIIENAVALCPNCHRRCHESADKAVATAQLTKKRSG